MSPLPLPLPLPPPPLLSVDQLTVAYGPVQAVRGISFAIPPQSVVALIGANGAGKTTILRAISGLQAPLAGRITYDGTPLAAIRACDRPGLGLIHVPEGRRIFGRLSVAENLDLGAFARRDAPAAIAADRDRVLSLFPRLAERRRQLAGTLSGGEQQMLAIGRGLMAAPRLLLMDEPSLGLAPQIVDVIFAAIDAIRRDGTTILLVEQNAYLALEIADQAFLLETGQITLSGIGRDLIDHPAVRRAYLG